MEYRFDSRSHREQDANGLLQAARRIWTQLQQRWSKQKRHNVVPGNQHARVSPRMAIGDLLLCRFAFRRYSYASATVMERLEERRLLAADATVGFYNGVLTLQGSDTTANTMEVSLSANGKLLLGTANNASRSVLLSRISEIRILGTDQSDTVRIDPQLTMGVFIDTQGGNDHITGGAGNDTIHAGDGNDTVLAGNGSDLVYGGAGNDFLHGEDGDDYLDGGAGSNVVKGEGGKNIELGGIIAKPTPPVVPPVVNKPTTPTSPVTPTIPTAPATPTTPTQPTTPTVPPIPTKPTTPPVSEKPTTKPSTPPSKEDGQVLPSKPVEQKPTTPSEPAAPTTPPVVPPVVTQPTVPTTPPVTTPTVPAKPTVPTVDPMAPVAVIQTIQSSYMVGSAVHVQGLDSLLKSGDSISNRYTWDFGDQGSNYNNLTGWNAAHVYDKAGQYTITLTVTDAQGRSGQATFKVNIAADTRRAIYVSQNGNDANDGSTQSLAVKTLAKAFSMLTDDSKILLQRGQRWDVATDGYIVNNNNVLIGAYGQGADPILRAVRWKVDNAIINLTHGVSSVTVQNLVFDSDQAHQTERTGTPVAIVARGTNLTIRDNTFLNVDFGVDGNGVPTGVLMQSNHAPLETGIRSCLAWVEGTDWVILGNDAANVTRQHTIRMQRYDRVLINDNQIANIDRQAKGDKLDWIKTVFWAMEGQHAYFANNVTTSGMIRVGPFQEGDDPSLRTRWIVLEGNNISKNLVEVMAGSEHIAIRNNTMDATNTSAIVVSGFSNNLKTATADVQITDNNAINKGSLGKFLNVLKNASGITLTGNTYTAPQLIGAAGDAAGVSIADNNVGALVKVDGNTWKLSATGFAWGTIMYVWPEGWSLDGAYSLDQWNALPQVGTDVFVETLIV